VTDQEKKPVLDEQTFERLLEAAYVLQEHNRATRARAESPHFQTERLGEEVLVNQASANQAPLQRSQAAAGETSRANGDYTLTLAEIVEAQHQIQMQHLGLDEAMAVVADRVARITGASGAAIGILEGSTVRYRAGAGAPALPVGCDVPLDNAICAASLRTGQVIRSEDVNPEFLFDPEVCRQRGILSLVVVPIYRENEIVGALELYFDRVHGFADQDIHTCQLMAGLVTEAIGRNAESTLKKSMAAERSSMLAAIERLQPNLVAWAGDQPSAQPAAAGGPSSDASAATAATSACWKCGSKLVTDEQFCGKCGAPRASDGGPASMQSKLASAWQMQQTSQDSFAAALPGGASPLHEITRPVAAHSPKNDTDLRQENARHYGAEPFSLRQPEDGNPTFATSLAAAASEDAMAISLAPESPVDENNDAPSTALVKPQQEDIVWTSAARARDFLESLSATRTPSALARFWRSRRGDFYLAVAVILVVAVIRWGIWSNHSVGATGRGTAVSGSASRAKQSAPDSNLSAFDKLLVGLGLAEAPETPEYTGNPNTQVWVDLQTALYYCPGADLYGKTPRGKLTSQRDARLDQFEPADRKACD
jgi:putative methionine-R-sulfoxide reductase with GAF domain